MPQWITVGGEYDFLAGEAADLPGDPVEVGRELLRLGVLVGPVRVVGVGVKGEPQPIGVVPPFALVAVGEHREVEPVPRREIDVEDELGPEFRVEALEHLQVEAVEERGVLLLGDVPEEKAVVIDRKPVPRPRVPVPDDPHPVLPAAGAAIRGGDDLRFLVLEEDLGDEGIARLRGGAAVHRHPVPQGRFAPHLDLQAAVGLPAQPAVQNGAVERLVDPERLRWPRRGRPSRCQHGARRPGGHDLEELSAVRFHIRDRVAAHRSSPVAGAWTPAPIAG